jgi:acylaminoacyl-peptidase
MRPLVLFVTLLSCSGVLALPASASDDTSPSNLLQPMDVFELEYASDPRISPNGSKIVYVRTSMDVMEDRRAHRLWMVNADGSDHRPLGNSEADMSSPRWSRDGTRLAFLSDADGSSQIYVRWMDTGETARLARLPESASGLSWSPDGRWLAFSMVVEKETDPLLEMPEPPEGAQWADPPLIIRSLQYRSDGDGYLPAGHEQVFVLPAEGGTPRQLTSGAFHHGGTLSWMPDSSALFFSANRSPRAEYKPLASDIWRIDLAGKTLNRLTDRDGPDFNPVVSPDGRSIAYLGHDDKLMSYQAQKLHVMDIDGSDPHVLSYQLDREVSNPLWAEDGRGIFVQYDDQGDTKIARISFDGDVEVLAQRVGGTSIGRPYDGGSFSVSENGDIAFTLTDTDHPADVAVSRMRYPKPRRLTHLNDDLLGHKTLGAVEEFWVDSSFDGRPIHGWIVTPPGFDPEQRYPMLLEIHGGPHANYGPRFSSELQLYAAAGFVVVYTNPRGSTSYGEEFAQLIHHAYPGNDYDDLMSAVDAVIARGFIDEDQLYVTGGSGGGVLTSWIVGKTDRFRAAVVAKPVINWASFVLTADAAPYFWRYWFPGYPWEYPEHYWARSPLSLVGNVTTPTMLLTGEEDHRTPMSESEQYYQALKLQEVPAALVRLPGASHGIAHRPSQLLAKIATILAWFDEHDGDDAE